jgi:Tfp pilus assembly protein PilW
MKRSNAQIVGIALIETLVATTMSAAMLAVLISAAIALQRGFSALDYQITSQEDEMRAVDYISRDLQRASTVEWSNNGRLLTITAPDQSDSIMLPIHPPKLVDGILSYGGTPVKIEYFVDGNAFIRAQDGVRTAISSTIDEFIGSTSGSLATFQVAFIPRFSKGDAAQRRDGARLSTTVFLRNAGQSQ